MRNQLKILLTVIILVFMTTACVPHLVPVEESTPESKTTVSVKEDLSEFTQIDIEAAGPIYLLQGNTHAIQIEGPQNLVENITYEVRDGVLIVKQSGDIWKLVAKNDYPTITITFENLNRFELKGGSALVANNLQSDTLSIEIQGGASLDMDNLNVSTLEVKIEGGTAMDISGVAETQTLRFSGGASYDAEDLQSSSISLQIEGAVSATVWATETLNLDLTGAYDVKYYGNPSITQDIKGIGNVESLGDK